MLEPSPAVSPSPLQTEGVSFYPHTHWDREWYAPFRTYQWRLVKVVDAVLDALELGTLSCFTLDGQTSLLTDYLELRPSQRPRLQRLIQSGQLSVGPWFVMPDEFLVCGEALIENLERGMAEARAWGCDTFTGYLPDTFGHSADIPTILRLVGIDTAVVWRGVAPERCLFQWESPAGDQVLTLHLSDGYFQDAWLDPTLSEAERQEALSRWLARTEALAVGGHRLLPVGGDHLGPPTAEALDTLRGMLPADAETTIANWMAARQQERRHGRLDAIETISGELRDNRSAFILPGVYSSRLDLKRRNRQLEQRLLRWVEPMLAWKQHLGQPLGEAETQALDTIWTLLLLNHPHDSIGGCSVDAVHRENLTRFDQADALAESLLRDTLDGLAHHLAPVQAQAGDWMVFNPGDRPFSGVVALEYRQPADEASPTPIPFPQTHFQESPLATGYHYDIRQVPMAHRRETVVHGWRWVSDIPAHGVRHLPLDEQLPLPVSPVGPWGSQGLQNDHIQVSVDAEGTLSVRDRPHGTTFSGLLRFTDREDQGDSYTSGPVPGKPRITATLTAVERHLEGPLMGALRLRHTISRDNQPPLMLETTVWLAAGDATLTFETQFRNRWTNHKVQVGFPTGKPIQHVQAETHFGRVERPYDPSTDETDRMPAPAYQELVTNTGPIQRWISAHGQLWATEGLTEYEVAGDTLYLTLLRAFGVISRDDTGARGAQAGPPWETPEGQLPYALMTARYAWRPETSEPADAFHWADRWINPPTGVRLRASGSETSGTQNTQSLVTWANPNWVSTRLKPDSEGGRCRIFNPTEQVQNGTWKGQAIEIGPKHIKTLVI